MKITSLKVLLIGLWLALYFPFKHAYVISENPTASLDLGVMEPGQDGQIDHRWKKCVSYLSACEIICQIKVDLSADYISDDLYHWLDRVEDQGHKVVYASDVNTRSSNQVMKMGIIEVNQILESLRNSSDRQASLILSHPVDFFRQQYHYFVSKAYSIIIKGNPTNWSSEDEINFYDNVEFLLAQDIKFTLIE